MTYTKPELFTEQFDVEDVITASSTAPETYDPTTTAFEAGFLPFGEFNSMG